MSTKITGLFGCPCHPFESVEDFKKHRNQKIEVGAKYKVRHTEKECIVTGLHEQPGFIKIFVEPYDCPRCNQVEHKQNLIKLKNYTTI